MSNPYREAVVAVDRMRWISSNFERFKELVANCGSFEDLASAIDSNRIFITGLTD